MSGFESKAAQGALARRIAAAPQLRAPDVAHARVADWLGEIAGTPAGAAFEVHTPIIDGAPDVVLVFVVGAVGAITLVECSKPHAAVRVSTPSVVTNVFTLVITSLCGCAQSCAPGNRKYRFFLRKRES